MSSSFVSDRRSLLGWLGAGAASTVLAACGSQANAGTYPVSFTEAEWRKRLSPGAFHILREKGTERPFSSPLLNEHRKGTFTCAADGNRLFASDTKYDSGTGWPSFWKAEDNAVGTSIDKGFFMTRTEVHCRRCGGHLGHVFPDGPKPTGDRHCINGVALKFVPKSSS